ncbi:MAG TPA: outer membrane beta-barrel domain-containing protein [Myxococcales bacterium]|nr:outer membrane beta-barrel domain-containing protein [Myxococcales bacterium]
MMRKFIHAILIILMTLPMAAAAQEIAADTDKKKVHVLEQRPFLHALRVELAPTFGYTVNEVLSEQLQVGGTLRFHLNETISVGGMYYHYFSSQSSRALQVQNEFELFPETSFPKWFAGGEINYTPIYGKMIVSGITTVHWNAYLSGGAGVTKTGAKDPLFTTMIGLGTRFFVTSWLTINVEARDYIYSEPFKAGSEIINNVAIHTGVSLFVPFTYNYRYPK